MLSDTSVVGSDDWWLTRLATRLGADYPRLELLRSYRDGDAPIPLDTARQVRDAYQQFIKLCRLNFAELIVAVLTSRMIPTGFRTAAAGDDNGDKVAQQIWRASHMNVQMRDHLDDFATYGRAGFAVDAPAAAGGLSPIARLTPWEYVIEADPWLPWVRLAGLRLGWDPVVGMDTLTLFRGGRMRVAVRDGRSTGKSMIAGRGCPGKVRLWRPGNGWSWTDEGTILDWTTEVPLVQSATRDGQGEFEGHIDALDRINHTILQRLIIVAMQAFRQRGVKGNLPRTYPTGHAQAGQEVDYNEIFKAGPAALWMLPPDAEIWESGVTDITPILSAVKDDLKHLAAVSSTPLYALSPDAASGSAEGAALSRETLIFKAEDRVARATDGIASTLSLAFQGMRDAERSDVSQIEVSWQPLDRSSLIERAAAGAQMKAGGAPFRLIAEKAWQLTPAEIEQAELDRAADAFLLGGDVPAG